MYLRHGAVVPHRVPISAQWKLNFWPAGVRVVSDFRTYEHFCNFYLFRNYQMNRTVVKRFLGKTVCCAITSLGSRRSLFGSTTRAARVSLSSPTVEIWLWRPKHLTKLILKDVHFRTRFCAPSAWLDVRT